MSSVNTTQFDRERSRLSKHPNPVPPIYQPEVAARAVLYAADHPRRKQYYVGATTVATIWANRLAPALLDRYLVRSGFDAQQTDQPPTGEDNLFEPVDRRRADDHGAHGIFDDTSHDRSWQATLARHPAATAVGGLAAVTAVAGLRRLSAAPR